MKGQFKFSPDQTVARQSSKHRLTFDVAKVCADNFVGVN